ncbi:MAG: ATP-binding protein, partial [Verrucomicrobia bacterium]|nr:ATP-binding protein [Verrucomicrobiota bacterium]
MLFVPATLRGLEYNMYSVRLWNMENGAPTDRINDIIQCSDGFIWMATYEGLIRFDGSSGRLFNHQDHPSLMGGIIVIAESAPGELWMLNNSNNLVRIRSGEFTVWTPQDGLPTRNTELLVTVPGGTVLLLGRNGFLTIDASDSVVEFPTPGLPFMGPGRYAFADDGTLWYAPFSGGLWSWQAGQAQSYTPSQMGASSDVVLNLSPRADGTVWLAVDDGAALLDPSVRQMTIFPDQGFQFQGRLLRFAKNSEGHLIGGNSLGNLFAFNKDGLEHFRLGRYEDKFEVIDGITALSGGGFAIATYSRGLMLLSPSLFPFYNRQNGLDGHLVNAITKQMDGTVLVATHSGAFVYDDGSFSPLTLDGAPFAEYLVDAFTDSVGRLWLATRTRGVLMRDEAGLWHQIDRTNGLRTQIARTFAEDASGNIWIGTRSGLHRWYSGLQEFYGLEHGLRSDYILNLHVDVHDNLWIGTVRGGLHRLAEGTIKPVSGTFEGQNPDTQTIFAITTDSAGIVWGGSNDGLFRIRNGEAEFFALWKKAAIGPIYHVIDDGVGYMWLTSAAGLLRFERAPFIEQVALPQRLEMDFRMFGRRNGLPTDAMRPVSRPMSDDYGRLWLATENGFIIVDPALITTSEEQIPVYFDGLEINGEPRLQYWHRSDIRLDLPPNLRRIQFRFTAPLFTANEVVDYRFRLNGFDTDWRYTEHNSVEYTNLPPGRYRFEVQAANQDGRWSDTSTSARFSVAPTLTQTYWFYPLIAVLLLGLISTVYAIRIQSNRRRQLELEQIVAERTSALRAREDELLASNQRLLELDRDKSNFLRIAAHDLRNPVSNIQSLAALMEDEIQRTGSTELKDFNKAVFSSTQRILELIRNLLDLDRIEQGQRRPDLQPCDPALMFREVVALNQQAANKKMIVLEIAASSLRSPLFAADPQLLVQVLDNLLSNALKFSPPNTKVTLKSEVFQDKVRLMVIDQGPGLTDSDQTRLSKSLRAVCPLPLDEP